MDIDNLYKLCLVKLMFRFVTNEIPMCLHNLFKMNYEIHNYQTRNYRGAHIPIN